jgi:predicted Fe-Mo cluster-binding NifX family protein
MKICATSLGETLDSLVDQRFGRSQYFLIVDSESMEFEAVKNPNIDAAGGAGIQSAMLVAKKEAEVLITGHCGPNGFHTLQAAGVEIVVGASGTVREAIEQYKKGELKPTQGPDVMSEFGMPGRKNYEL